MAHSRASGATSSTGPNVTKPAALDEAQVVGGDVRSFRERFLTQVTLAAHSANHIAELLAFRASRPSPWHCLNLTMVRCRQPSDHG